LIVCDYFVCVIISILLHIYFSMNAASNYKCIRLFDIFDNVRGVI
jgi:hypothetical protein